MGHIQPQICQHGFVVVFLLLSLPWKGADCQLEGYRLNAQESVSVASGLCVEIPCTFTISASRILSPRVTGIWRRTDISDIVAASTDASKVSERTKGRFTLTGKVHGGDCSFSISNAQPEDQGDYEFRFEDGDLRFSYSWYLLSVTVTKAGSQTPSDTLCAQRSVSVESGLCVEIPCRFTISSYRTLSPRVTGMWRRTDISDIVAASTDASKVSDRTKGRFTLTGKVHEGDCSFSISNAQPEDQGIYVFQFEDRDIKYSYSLYKLSVTVTRAGSQTPSDILCAQRSVSVASGLCVEIPCRFTISSYRTLSPRVTGMWRRTDISDIVASTDASKVSQRTKGRFTLTGKVHEGDCSFSISKAQPEDQGIYVFQFEDRYYKYSYSLYKLSVTVTNLPEPTISPVRNLIAGEQITLTCTSHPAPQGCKGMITWEGIRNIVNTNNYKENNTAGKVTSTSDLTFTPSQGDHKSSLTCTVTYSGVSTKKTITLDVEYTPRKPTILNCTSKGCLVEVIEGTSLSLLCSAESNPPANLSWAKQNSADPLNSSSGRLQVSNVSTNNEGDYMCQAMNKHGSLTTSIKVTIIYSPRRLTINNCTTNDCLMHDNAAIEILEGYSLYLQCDADSKPQANVFWVKLMQNGTVTLISTKAQLNVTNATSEYGGKYMCQATNKVGNASKSITLIITSLKNVTTHLEGVMFGGIVVSLLVAIVITAVLVIKYKKTKKPPEQVEERISPPPNTYEAVYCNIDRRTFDKEPNMGLSSPNECKSPDEDLQYVTLDISRSKPIRSPEPQETIYAEVKSM
ncbi:sialic acid-binding Ig-like lectin 12 isoform X1 [Xenopus laevis]|uniref:Sialic acid-binding Ig-like lectin 12 isoform X1 n=1 Tax=Xenopus laevis TaxID=8355 RepID=A0A8J1LAG3_XENLA|nr:sialic acid-binding Ig-like lectin 12 isoform X1 [Xenopus laevis]XP_041425636.1 sialic acid-binding Ig-like lectin 12 isoform X1 [Xenopus laevis]